ncbi:alpha-1,6-mannosyltransferase Och1, partial [Teratosphaeriaceae sp. CCFEE 6253]
MLTFRRALAVAAVILTCFLILRNTHSARLDSPTVHNSPKPTGSYHDNKVIQDTPPDVSKTGIEPTKAASTGAAWKGDDSGRVALAKKPVAQLALDDVKALPLRKQLSYAFP